MTERSRFWDGTATGDASIAPYDAGTEFAAVMSAISGAAENSNQGGVWVGMQNGLVWSVPAANTVRVASGNALVHGTWYENDTNVDVTIPTPAGATRIDLIVLRKSWSAQTVRITRIAGVEGGGAPAVTQSAGVTWDVPLYEVSITTGGVIAVTDRRAFLGIGRAGATNENILLNPSFEVWQRGTTGQPDAWFAYMFGTSSVAYLRESTIIKGLGLYSARYTYTHNQDSAVAQTIETHQKYRLLALTLSMEVYTATANGLRLYMGDTLAGPHTLGAYHPGGSRWVRLSVTRTILATSDSLRAGFQLEASGTYYVDNAKLEVSPFPTPYIPPDASEELARCQRRYESHSGDTNFPAPVAVAAGAGDRFDWPISFNEAKGGQPTLTKNGTWAVTNTAQPVIDATGGVNGYRIRLTSTAAGLMGTNPDSADDGITAEWNP